LTWPDTVQLCFEIIRRACNGSRPILNIHRAPNDLQERPSPPLANAAEEETSHSDSTSQGAEPTATCDCRGGGCWPYVGGRVRPAGRSVDDEIEAALRKQLLELLPARWRGEETGVLAGAGGPYCWLVDPHDGTSAFLAGEGGSSVSIALLRDGVPVLGVVHAPLSPDRGPDTIAWAEGLDHLLRTGLRSRECWLMPHCLWAPSCS
jgi:3'-phosphoadenosine 5'-phosphosulfate (PAPS) 3'-phosphatase